MDSQAYKAKEPSPKKLVATLKKFFGRGTVSMTALAEHIAKIQEESQLETPAAKCAFFEELATQFNLTADNHNELILLLIKKEQELNRRLKSISTHGRPLTSAEQTKMMSRLIIAEEGRIRTELTSEFKSTLSRRATPADLKEFTSLLVAEEQKVDDTDTSPVTSTTSSLYQYYYLYVLINHPYIFDKHKTAIYQVTNRDETYFEKLKKTILLSEEDKALLARLSENDLWILRNQGKRTDHEIVFLLGNPTLLKKMIPRLNLQNFLPLLGAANKKLGLLLAHHECSMFYKIRGISSNDRLKLIKQVLEKYDINLTEAPFEETGIDQEILALRENYGHKYNELDLEDADIINAAFNKYPALENHLLSDIFELHQFLVDSSKEKKPAYEEVDLKEINRQWNESHGNKKQEEELVSNPTPPEKSNKVPTDSHENKKESTNKKTNWLSSIKKYLLAAAKNIFAYFSKTKNTSQKTNDAPAKPAKIEESSFTKAHKALEKEFLALFQQPKIPQQNWEKATVLAKKTYLLYKDLFQLSLDEEKILALEKEEAAKLLTTIVTKIEESSSLDIPKKETQIASIADGNLNSTPDLTEEQKAKRTAETIKRRILLTPRMRAG